MDTIGMLKQSQVRMNRAALLDESISNEPARCKGWFATIPTVLPFNLPKPTITLIAHSL